MFQTIMKLYEAQETPASAAKPPVKGKYIYFGASVVYCDEKNVCMVYYPRDNDAYPPLPPLPPPDVKTVVSSS
jgi:hypothetical protein